ncbi:class I SAM-dependent methyltransferase [Haloferax sp. ATB1]|uniref:class I SAM-dependent methyltransferase n=1 Tax=Haloferax sp. ATB1 TaxID=1508454 RepID=UPI000694A526|nr:class I SAM-dependent methyltransferase [Haloferax sp. ATB1]
MTKPTDSPSHRLFAAIYDPVTKPAERTLLREHREYLTEDLHGAVLDIGAGTGAMFPYFERAQTRDSELVVHAVEPDPHMRRRAVQKAKDVGLDVEIRSDGAQSLSYDDDSFDVVVGSLVFCTIPDVDAALGEIARVLKPGGELRFLEHVHADGWVGSVQNAVNPVWRRGAAECHLNRDTRATFESEDRFEMREIDELAIGVPPVKPFICGTLVARTRSQNRWLGVLDDVPEILGSVVR